MQTGDRMYKEYNKSQKNKHHVYRAGCAKCKYLPMQKKLFCVHLNRVVLNFC